jgi:hypothetical protein
LVLYCSPWLLLLATQHPMLITMPVEEIMWTFHMVDMCQANSVQVWSQVQVWRGEQTTKHFWEWVERKVRLGQLDCEHTTCIFEIENERER